MIRVIDNHLSAGCQPLLHSLFVDLFGWDVPVVEDQFEIDQFDTADAVYIVISGPDGAHAASLRLLPTTKPHMFDTQFSHLCPVGVPVGETIWESTRLCLPQRHGAGGRRELRNRMISAMVDWALERRITRYTGLLPDSFRKEVLAMGWQAEPLGPAVRMTGGMVGAFAINIDTDTPERLGWTGTYTGKAEWVMA